MNLILHCRMALICIRRNPIPNPNLDHELSIYSHSHTACRSHFHTAVGLRSFPFVVSLSFSYSGRATLILHCRVAIILIQRSDYTHFTLPCRYHSHTAVGLRSFCIVAIILIQRSGYAHFTLLLSLSYSGRATLILHCRVALIVIQRSSCAHFTLPYRSH